MAAVVSTPSKSTHLLRMLSSTSGYNRVNRGFIIHKEIIILSPHLSSNWLSSCTSLWTLPFVAIHWIGRGENQCEPVCSFRSMLCPMWSLDQQHQHHMGACNKCRSCPSHLPNQGCSSFPGDSDTTSLNSLFETREMASLLSPPPSEFIAFFLLLCIKIRGVRVGNTRGEVKKSSRI